MLLPTNVELFTTLVAVMLVAANANVPPTAPVKVTVPVPAVIVNARAEVKLFNVLPNVMLLFVVEIGMAGIVVECQHGTFQNG